MATGADNLAAVVCEDLDARGERFFEWMASKMEADQEKGVNLFHKDLYILDRNDGGILGPRIPRTGMSAPSLRYFTRWMEALKLYFDFDDAPVKTEEGKAVKKGGRSKFTQFTEKGGRRRRFRLLFGSKTDKPSKQVGAQLTTIFHVIGDENEVSIEMVPWEYGRPASDHVNDAGDAGNRGDDDETDDRDQAWDDEFEGEEAEAEEEVQGAMVEDVHPTLNADVEEPAQLHLEDTGQQQQQQAPGGVRIGGGTKRTRDAFEDTGHLLQDEESIAKDLSFWRQYRDNSLEQIETQKVIVRCTQQAVTSAEQTLRSAEKALRDSREQLRMMEVRVQEMNEHVADLENPVRFYYDEGDAAGTTDRHWPSSGPLPRSGSNQPLLLPSARGTATVTPVQNARVAAANTDASEAVHGSGAGGTPGPIPRSPRVAGVRNTPYKTPRSTASAGDSLNWNWSSSSSASSSSATRGLAPVAAQAPVAAAADVGNEEVYPLVLDLSQHLEDAVNKVVAQQARVRAVTEQELLDLDDRLEAAAQAGARARAELMSQRGFQELFGDLMQPGVTYPPAVLEIAPIVFMVVSPTEINPFKDRNGEAFRRALDYNAESAYKHLPPVIRRRVQFYNNRKGCPVPEFLRKYMEATPSSWYTCPAPTLTEIIMPEMDEYLLHRDSTIIEGNDPVAKMKSCVRAYRKMLLAKGLRERWVMWPRCIRYAVSFLGRIFDTHEWRLVEPYEIANPYDPHPNTEHGGYLGYTIYANNGGTVQIEAHRLVAGIFLINDDPIHYCVVDHLNRRTYDNSVFNLAFATLPHNRRNRELHKQYIENLGWLITGMSLLSDDVPSPVKVEISHGDLKVPHSGDDTDPPGKWTKAYRLDEFMMATRNVLRFLFTWYNLYQYKATQRRFRTEPHRTTKADFQASMATSIAGLQQVRADRAASNAAPMTTALVDAQIHARMDVSFQEGATGTQPQASQVGPTMATANPTPATTNTTAPRASNDLGGNW
jgi:hypothetical protein